MDGLLVQKVTVGLTLRLLFNVFGLVVAWDYFMLNSTWEGLK